MTARAASLIFFALARPNGNTWETRGIIRQLVSSVRIQSDQFWLNKAVIVYRELTYGKHERDDQVHTTEKNNRKLNDAATGPG